MNKYVTDEPKTNLETMLNYAYAKDWKVYLRYAGGREDIDLCCYISEMAMEEHGCKIAPEDLIEGGCMECDCELAILYTVAGQAAELRARLKAYEDTGLTPEEIQNSKKNDPLTVEELKTMAGQPYWHVSLIGNTNVWSILDPHFCKNPESYNYGKDWLAYRLEKKDE